MSQMNEPNHGLIIPKLSDKGIIDATFDDRKNNYPNYKDTTLQKFNDNGKKSDRSFAKTSELMRTGQKRHSQRNGEGIFQSVNSVEKKKRRNKTNISHVNSWVVDIDGMSKEKQAELFNTCPIKPSAIVESKNSFHGYWFAEDGKIETRVKICLCLAGYFDGDLSVAKDRSKVLRLPGHLHLKDPKDPFLVKCLYIDPEMVYTEDDMLEAYGKYQKEEVPKDKKPTTKKSTASKAESKSKNVKPDIRKEMASWNNKEMLCEVSGEAIVKGDIITFKDNPSGTQQIRCNGESTGCWLDTNLDIGSGDGGGPTRIQWVLRYGIVNKAELLQYVKERFANKLKQDFSEYTHTYDDSITIGQCLILNKKGKITGIRHRYCALFCHQKSCFGVTKEGYFYTYKKGIWVVIKETELGNMVKTILIEDIGYKNLTTKDVGIIIKWIALEKYDAKLTQGLVETKEFDLCLNDCIIAVNDSYTKSDHSPDEYKFMKLPYNSRLLNDDTLGEPTAWLRFLSDVLHHYTDKVSILRAMRAFFGYCLIPSVSLTKSLLLLGTTGQGKSTLITVLENMLGMSNVAHQKLDDLQESKFNRIQLLGKAINVDSDLNEQRGGVGLDFGVLKQLFDGSTISAEWKGKDSFDIKPNVKFILATNHGSGLGLEKATVQRRLLIFTFARASKGIDTELPKKLLAERDKIFVWSYRGLQDLMDNPNIFNHKELQALHAKNTYNTFLGKEKCTMKIVDEITKKGMLSNKNVEAIIGKYKGLSVDEVKEGILSLGNISYKRRSNGMCYTIDTP